MFISKAEPNKSLVNLFFLILLSIALLASLFATPAQFQPKARAAGEMKPFPQQVNYSGIIKPNHVSQASMNASVTSYYDSWKSKYLKNNLSSLPGGYYVKGEITGSADGFTPLGSSEGQGYGMVISVLMAGYDQNAKTIYDGLFKTARAYKSSGNSNLMGWVVADNAGAQGHFGSATDGDLDIAYSLILAHYQWGSNGTINYLAEANKMITNGIKASNVTTNNRLNLGDWDSKSALNTRPSDWMLSHMRAFYDVTGDQTWLDVINNLYTVYNQFSSAYSATTGLISDFVVGNPAQPAPRNFLDEFPETDEYNYNAARVPLRIVMDYALYGDIRGKTIADKIAVWIKGKTSSNPGNIKDGYKLNGTVTGSASGATGVFVSPFIASAVTSSTHQAWVNSGWDWMKNNPSDYFSDSYTLLSMLFISGNWWKPGAGVTPPTDTQAPSAPTNLTATAASSSQINLSWTASTDNVGVSGYQIYRNGIQISTTPGTSFSNTGLSANTSFSYTVKAYDAASNVSSDSNTSSATTSSTTPTPTPTPTPTATPASITTGGTVTASSTSSPAGEEKEKAFDGNVNTKWLTVANTGWIQYQLTAAKTVAQYSIASANDFPTRDPKNWTLKGSNDGTNWTTLDTRTNQTFANRFQTNTFTFSNSTAYKYYRLDVSANSGDTLLQIAEIGLFSTTSTPTPTPTPGTGNVLYVNTGALSTTAGSGATTNTVTSAGGTNHDGTPTNAITYLISGLSRTYNSTMTTTFNLYVDAGANAGDGVQVQVQYDFTGDGVWDRTETYNYFATNPVADWENYVQTQGLKSASGSFANLVNGKIQIKVWNAIGNTSTSLRTNASSANGQQSILTIPYN